MKNHSNFSPSKLLAAATFWAGVIGTTNSALAQNLADVSATKAKIENAASTTNATDFAVENVGKYYPDMTDYTKKMMNSFRNKEQKDVINKILAKIVKKYTNPEEKIRFIIGTLEGDVINTGSTKFSDTYWTEPTEEDMACYEEFQNSYKIRFDSYEKQFNSNLAALQEEIKQMKEEIAKDKEEIAKDKEEIAKDKEEIAKDKEEIAKDKEEIAKDKIITEKYIKNISIIMENFSKEDVLKDKNLYNLIKDFKEATENNKRPKSTHQKELFDLIK